MHKEIFFSTNRKIISEKDSEICKGFTDVKQRNVY